MGGYLLALLIGFTTGLRAFTPTAVISWAARLGVLHLEGTWLAFLAHPVTPYILTTLAIAELIGDKLPVSPSRKAPLGFFGRVILGALSGMALLAPTHVLAPGLILGVLGAIAGTLGGYEFRRRLVQATGGRDLPIALLEDAIAIGASILIVSRV